MPRLIKSSFRWGDHFGHTANSPNRYLLLTMLMSREMYEEASKIQSSKLKRTLKTSFYEVVGTNSMYHVKMWTWLRRTTVFNFVRAEVAYVRQNCSTNFHPQAEICWVSDWDAFDVCAFDALFFMGSNFFRGQWSFFEFRERPWPEVMWSVTQISDHSSSLTKRI